MKNYEKWFKKAEEDIYTAKLLLKETDSPVCIICFHSQQAAEKYLKAYLVVRNIDFPKTHDLKILINICLTFNQKFSEIEKISSRLSEFGTYPRYPDAFDDIVLSHAQQAFENAIIIKEFVLKYFFH